MLEKSTRIIYILIIFCCTIGSGLCNSNDGKRIRKQTMQPPPYLLLYSFGDSLTIQRLNLDGTGYFLVRDQALSVPSPPTPQILSIDYSYTSNKIYFSLGTRIGVGSLYESNQLASSLTLIDIVQLEEVGALTYDWIRDRLYFIGTASGVQGLYSYDFSSKFTIQLTHFSNPSDLSKVCIAAQDTLIFWNEGNVIRFGSPIGSASEFATFDSIAPSSGNVVDLFCVSSQQYLYVYLSGGSVNVYDYTVSISRIVDTITTLIDEGPLSTSILFPTNALRFASFDSNLFFLIPYKNYTYVLRTIQSSQSIVNYPTIIVTNSFALVQPNLQPGVPAYALACGAQGCCTDNGNCSQICLQVSVDSYLCSCRPGFTLASFTECSLSPNTTRLIYSYYEEASNGARLGVIRSRNIDGQPSEESLVSAQYMGVQTKRIEQLAISLRNNELYFVERLTVPILARVSLSDSSVKTTILNSITVANLRYDWLNDYLYWTTGSSILRMRPTDVTFETFLSDSALALALDPIKDLICYSVISNATSDVICVNSTLNEIFHVSLEYVVVSLALDLIDNRIYWGGQYSFISCSVFDSSDCFQIPYPSLPDSNKLTYFIYIAGDRLVWLPEDYESIVHMNKLDGSDVILFTISSPSANILSVNALDISVFFYQPGSGYLSCLRDNGGCSHFCIPSSDGSTFSCGCPNGYNFIDNTTCEFVVPETTAAPTVTAIPEQCPTDFCFNDGTCTSSIALGFTCTCISYFTGPMCADIDVTLFLSSADNPQEIKIAIGVMVLVGVILAILVIVGASAFFFFLRHRHFLPVTQEKEKEATEPSSYVNQNLEIEKKPYVPNVNNNI